MSTMRSAFGEVMADKIKEGGNTLFHKPNEGAFINVKGKMIRTSEFFMSMPPEEREKVVKFGLDNGYAQATLNKIKMKNGAKCTALGFVIAFATMGIWGMVKKK